MIDLLEQYGLPVYISGHLHLQRVKKHGNGRPSQAEESYGIYEIVSDSMVIPPCQYGELRWQEDGSVQYETCPVDVAGWAASQGITDENLLNFPQYSGDFLIETVQNQGSRRVKRHSGRQEIPHGQAVRPDQQCLLLWEPL